MKRNVKFFAMILLAIVSIVSCDKDENDVDEQITAEDKEKLMTTVQSGDWLVTTYVKNQTDNTNNYVGYVFQFNADGTLGATDGNTSVSGAWSVTSTDDSHEEEDEIDFNIFFTTPDLFEILADDWEIVRYTSSKIELKNDDESTTVYLTFEKM